MKVIKNIQEYLSKNKKKWRCSRNLALDILSISNICNSLVSLQRALFLERCIRQICTWFKVENKVCIFFMEEFGLVSGLNYKPIYESNIDNVGSDDSARLYKELTNGLERCTTFKLEDMFMNFTSTDDRKL